MAAASCPLPCKSGTVRILPGCRPCSRNHLPCSSFRSIGIPSLPDPKMPEGMVEPNIPDDEEGEQERDSKDEL